MKAILKWLRMQNSAIRKYENDVRAESKAEGKAEAEGLEQGKAGGLEQGKAEAMESMAINMLKQNLDIKLISQVTGLTVENISKLKSN